MQYRIKEMSYFQNSELYFYIIMAIRAFNDVIVYTIVIFCGYKTYIETKQSAHSQKAKHLQQMLTIMMFLQVIYFGC